MNSARRMLAAMRARARVGIAVEGAACVAAAFVVHGVVSYALDRWLHLEVGYRGALLLGLFAWVALIVVRRLVRPLRTTLDDEELALAVERHDPALRQALISALEFEDDLRQGRDHGESASLMRSVIDDVDRRTASIAFVRALDGRRVLRHAGLLAAALVVAVTWFAAGGQEARIWAQRDLFLGSQPWPRETWLRFDEIDATVPLRIAEREDVRVRVVAEGVVPERVELRGRFAGGQDFVRQMDRIGGSRFALTLETLLEDVDVVAAGGDGETGTLSIRLVPRPRVSDLEVAIDYPDYMEREAEALTSTGGDLRVPRGSTLTLTAQASKPLRRAELVFGQDARLPADIVGDGAREVRARFSPKESGELRLDLLDTDDLGPIAPPVLHLRVVDDAAPSLDFTTEGIGSAITPNARIPGLLEVRDDYGVETVAASFRTTTTSPPTDGERGPEPEFVPAPVSWEDELRVGATEVDLGVVFDLLPLAPDADPQSDANRIRPGMLLSIRFTATDVLAPEPNEGQSEVLNLRVVTREELIEELTRRQLEQRRELERVRRDQVDARAELSDIVSSASEDPRAQSARLRTESLGRQQLAAAKKVQGIADRYARIVAEMTNNRLGEPATRRKLETDIVVPLGTLAGELLPSSAELVEAFAAAGTEDARRDCIEAYDEIIRRIDAVLAQMDLSESIAAIVETLRGVIRTEREVDELIERLRAEQGEGVFEPTEPRDEDQNR